MKSRWNRLSLRTLFFVTTIFAVWLNWQIGIVRERSTELRRIRNDPAIRVVLSNDLPPNPLRERPSISLVRTLLGDKAIGQISYDWNANLTQEELSTWHRVFPESTINQILPEPCHPGCFPKTTIVKTSLGGRAIETIREGDLVFTFNSDGSTAEPAKVTSIFKTKNQFWQVDTEGGSLITTGTQPLIVQEKGAVQVGNIHPGMKIIKLIDGHLVPVKVLSVNKTKDSGDVFNLILGDAELFLANDFFAKSKPPKASSLH